MKKKAAIIFTAVFLIVTVIMHDGDLAVITSSFNASSISAKAAVLMCADTGEVLFSLNKDLRLPMASTTKIMTALIALEDPSPMREIKVTKEMVAVEGTSMGLLPEDTISLYTLSAGMLRESGYDAANVTAYAIAGGLNEFAKLMNKKAKELGLKNTNFVTPSGLDADKHYSTAYDLALLGAAAIKNPLFKEICSQKSMKVEFGNPPYPRWLYNHNRLLSSYEGTIGIKTGYTKKSGRCLVSAAERNGITLVAVTLNAPDDWNDHKKMFDYGFSVMKQHDLNDDFSNIYVDVVGGKEKRVAVTTQSKPQAAAANNLNLSKVKREILIKPFEYAPIKSGEILGTVRYYLGDRLLEEQPLCAAADVEIMEYEIKEKERETLFEKLKNFFSGNNKDNKTEKPTKQNKEEFKAE